MSVTAVSTDIFHLTCRAKPGETWCTAKGIPDLLIEHLCFARRLTDSRLFAFCILPDHVHALIAPGEDGIATFANVFRSGVSKDVRVRYPRTKFPGWERRYVLRQIRTPYERHLASLAVHYDAAEHGLVEDAVDWPWTSLHYPLLLDDLGSF